MDSKYLKNDNGGRETTDKLLSNKWRAMPIQLASLLFEKRGHAVKNHPQGLTNPTHAEL